MYQHVLLCLVSRRTTKLGVNFLHGIFWCPGSWYAYWVVDSYSNGGIIAVSGGWVEGTVHVVGVCGGVLYLWLCVEYTWDG